MLPPLIGFILLVVMVLSSIWLADQQQHSFTLVRRALEVENGLSSVFSELQDAETGQRGFLLTGEPVYLKPYEAAIARIDRDVNALAATTADNPRQQVSLRRLRDLSEARQEGMRQNIALFRSGDHVGATARLDRGRGLMDQIRGVIANLKAEQRDLLLARERVTERQARLAQAALALNGLLIAALAFFTFRQAHYRLAAAVASAEALKTSAANLKAANAHLEAELATREAAEAQVRQMQKMESIGQLTGGIAHDFNNMLAIVIGSLDIAKRRLDSDRARALVGIDNALEGARRAALLTARLLAFSRQLPLEPRALDVNKLVAGMSEMLRHTIGEQLRVETVLAGGLWPAFVDPSQLENAILNLVINARDAMPEGGRLTVETSNAHLDDAYV